MKSLSSPITTEAAAENSGWVEIYDIYLKSAITTPWGSTNILRLCSRLGKELSFFTPQVAPEAAGTLGNAATYYPWPLKRQPVKSSGTFTDHKLEITGSNVTAEWAEMVSTIDWYDTPVMIRLARPDATGATAADCAIVFSGLVDSIRVNDKAITLICSNDLALLNRILPSENMHASCRFKMFDDQCTLIKFKQENYKAMLARNDCTTTLVRSNSLTQDAGSSSSYGTDIVDALSSGNITASSEAAALTGTLGVVSGSRFGGSYELFVINSSVLIGVGTKLRFPSTPPSGFSTMTWYYVIYASGVILLSATPGGTRIFPLSTSGTWAIEGEVGYDAHRVRMQTTLNFWAFSTDADWGTVDNAYYVIPDAQAGMKNAALKPYIQFDFSSAKQPRVWRVASVANGQDEERLRIIQFFSSTNASTWTFESYFEMPNRGGEFFDVLIPNASSARYWRICVRSRWAESLYKTMFYRVQAYENSRNYWRDGYIQFDADTITPALQNVRRRILASYNLEVLVQELPTVPSLEEEFVIVRGCNRTFNACAERRNTENYGGFNDLPLQTVIR